eukprot:1398776-Pyramimonas_sp.AAC.1
MRGDSCGWHIQYGNPQGMTGATYTDGACSKMWYWPDAAKAGWGFCQLREPMRRGAEMLVPLVCLPPVVVHADDKGL